MKKLPKISDAEWQVMKVLWKKSPITSSEIVEILKPINNWSTTTIYTLINRLINKKAIAVEEGTSPRLCYPLISEEESSMEESSFFLKKVFNGSLNIMLANFLKNDKLSKKEIEELKHILDDTKK